MSSGNEVSDLIKKSFVHHTTFYLFYFIHARFIARIMYRFPWLNNLVRDLYFAF